ncbi:relaxase/mobilization nuclease domain-containing protein [Polaribacter sp. Asnod6-C07]|uniref:relaxase/mobilization nuclease domain-containing protein n=1 Tax=Polaribacter sp. Asnod6-C07 TaxID=3160582 RepID=UPI0038672DDA
MISKAKSCPGGTALFNYVINENKGYELLRNNISGVTPKEMYSDFSILQQQNLRCKNNTISIVLSPTINDSIKMTNEQLKLLAEDFLKEMDLDPKTNQFIAFVHTEKEHKHVHIILNRVKNNGTLIKDSFISKRAQFVAHEVAIRHGWTSAKELKIKKEQERILLYKKVRKIIKKAHYLVLRMKPKNLQAYQIKMAKFGIKVNPTINKQGNIQGFRFVHEASSTDLKASEVDRNLKLNQLFLVEKSTISNNVCRINKTIDLKEYNLNTADFNSIISLLSFEDGDDTSKKQKQHRKRDSINY